MVAALYFGWRFAGTPQRPVALPRDAPASKSTAQPATPAPPITPSSPPAMAQGAATTLTTVEEGDQLIDEIIRSEKPIPEMARDLNALVQRLNGEAQVNASRHLVNLTSDEDYGLIAGFLVDQKMNPEVIEVLFSDLMNRKRELQLPLFMNILKNPQHPQNEQVRNVMTILASQDFGNDYAAWDKWAAEEIKRIQSEQ
ncbi:MAG TPA: hypothetical protein VD994_13875 [Prosthecobacter sp.]|nr:hypothetical protein [Prosthecobacter sp.]